jgi:hypothetical protein
MRNKKTIIITALITTIVVLSSVIIYSNFKARGLEAWDGRDGGSSGTDSMTLSESRRAAERYYEVHVVFETGRKSFDFNGEKRQTIEEAIQYLKARTLPEPLHEFWGRVIELKHTKRKADEAWRNIIDLISQQCPEADLWTLRAFEDEDEHGKKYKALELSARIKIPECVDTIPPGFAKMVYTRSKPEAVMQNDNALNEIMEENPALRRWLEW